MPSKQIQLIKIHFSLSEEKIRLLNKQTNNPKIAKNKFI